MKQLFTILFLSIAIFAKSNDGDLDLSFGNQGKIITTINGKNFVIRNENNSVVTQPDNKIIIVGSIDNRNAPFYTDFAVIRYNPNGTLDNSFGNNGLVTIDIGQDYEYATAVALQSDGKIIVVGNSDTAQATYPTINAQIGVARLNINGALDTSFFHSGKSLYGFGFNLAYFANDVDIDNFNRIILAGYYSPANSQYFDLLFKFRINYDGTFTLNFGDLFSNTQGQQPTINYNEANKNVKIYPDGKILIVGKSAVELPGSGTQQTILLTKFKEDGQYDSTFGINGISLKYFVDLYSLSNVYTSVILSDGSILVGGSSYNSNDDFGFIRKYTINGEIDSTFGSNGTVFSNSSNGVTSLILNSSGKITVCEGSLRSFKISRFNGNGSKDLSFGVNGVTYTTFVDTFVSPMGIVMQANERILVVGIWANIGSRYGDGLSLARYGSNGVGIEEQEDNSFSFYPNPTKDFIKIEGVSKGKTLNIINVFGKRVLTYVCKSENESIDISTLSAGMYFVDNQKFIKE